MEQDYKNVKQILYRTGAVFSHPHANMRGSSGEPRKSEYEPEPRRPNILSSLAKLNIEYQAIVNMASKISAYSSCHCYLVVKSYKRESICAKFPQSVLWPRFLESDSDEDRNSVYACAKTRCAPQLLFRREVESHNFYNMFRLFDVHDIWAIYVFTADLLSAGIRT